MSCLKRLLVLSRWWNEWQWRKALSALDRTGD